MSLWSRRKTGADRPEEASALEDEGKLEEAAAAYERASHPLHAIRVMLALADSETDPRARVRLLAKAARIGLGEIDTPRDVRVRYAKARLDLAAQAPASSLLPSELSELGRELSDEGEHVAAATAFRLAGDTRRAAEALAAAGELDALEDVLDAENAKTKEAREKARALAEVEAMAAAGQRVAAIDEARRCSTSPDDDLARAAARIERSLVTGAHVVLADGDRETTLVLGEALVLGRVEGELLVPSPVVSRRHLRFFRGADGAPRVEDLGGRNGTYLAGAKLDGAIAIASPLTLSLGRQLPLVLSPRREGGIVIEVAGARYDAPLGSAIVGPWLLSRAARALRLSATDASSPPLLGGALSAPEGVDLAIGDSFAETRGGPVRLRVLR